MIKLYQSAILSQFPGIKHFFSSRLGGYSVEPFQFANLSLKAGDDQALRNRFLLAQSLGVPLERFVLLQQTHSDNVRVVTEKDAGRGAFRYATALPDTDAIITNTAGIMLTVTTADCVPILIFDAANKVIAAVHSGWRGTVKQILRKTIEKMQSVFGTKPGDLYAAIGPAIGACCYQVGPDVEQAVQESFGSKKFLHYRQTGIYFDLWEANREMLRAAGVPDRQIDVLSLCTSCHDQEFYSARKGDRGRQLSGIMLNI